MSANRAKHEAPGDLSSRSSAPQQRGSTGPDFKDQILDHHDIEQVPDRNQKGPHYKDQVLSGTRPPPDDTPSARAVLVPARLMEEPATTTVQPVVLARAAAASRANKRVLNNGTVIHRLKRH
jgi:hypothetical protein